MGGFKTIYTPEQKAVVIRLVIDEGHTVNGALALAKQGLEGLPGFEMNPSTAHNLVWRERQRRRSAEFEERLARNPNQALRQIRDRMAVFVDELVTEIEQRDHPVSAKEIRDALKVTQSLATLTRSLNGQPAPPGDTAPGNTRDKTPDPFTAKLLASQPELAAGFLREPANEALAREDQR